MELILHATYRNIGPKSVTDIPAPCRSIFPMKSWMIHILLSTIPVEKCAFGTENRNWIWCTACNASISFECWFFASFWKLPSRSHAMKSRTPASCISTSKASDIDSIFLFSTPYILVLYVVNRPQLNRRSPPLLLLCVCQSGSSGQIETVWLLSGRWMLVADPSFDSGTLVFSTNTSYNCSHVLT